MTQLDEDVMKHFEDTEGKKGSDVTKVITVKWFIIKLSLYSVQ